MYGLVGSGSGASVNPRDFDPGPKIMICGPVTIANASSFTECHQGKAGEVLPNLLPT